MLPREISIFSLLVPTLLFIFLSVGVVFIFLDLTLSRRGLYRYTWHPALFRVSLLISLFCMTALFLQ
ncbi:DUF1656 domain-containing protein [Pseudomonas aeruginosa]|uniref:DUF1656 domain-containing protein n=1 Tax=Pseudomonas aeruginosa TaxID=287 RepID=UPI0034D36158